MKTKLLNVVAKSAAECTSCELHKSRNNSVFSRGSVDSRVAFLGEAPGAHEDEQGLPFVGRSGKLLNNMIATTGLDPDKVYVCNICKCRPPDNRKPTQGEMNSCSEFLKYQLTIVAPKVIVALGSTAVEGLLGPGPGITKRRGKWEEWNNIQVMPTFHPSYCLRNPSKKQDVWEDLQKVVEAL
jgi:DNA polymerase